ncbi:MAG: tetratricopeptide repeat protein [Chlamydiota bacterium]
MFRMFMLLLMLFIKSSLYSGYDDGISVYYYNGIPGCGCFTHCTCMSSCASSMAGTNFHPQCLEDKLWHEFMYKLLSANKSGPYIPSSEFLIRSWVSSHNPCGFVCLLSEYLTVAETFGSFIEQARAESINWYKDLYNSPKEKKVLEIKINMINERARNAFQILSSIPATITPMYKEVLEKCCHQSSDNMAYKYNMGLIYLLEGNVENSLESIASFIEYSKKNGKESLLNSEIFQNEGEAFLEVGLYHQAIESLNKAISKDPKTKRHIFNVPQPILK